MLEFVPVASLGQVWPLVEEGLEKILERCPDTWTPKIVRQALIDGRASLYAERNGFFVVEVKVDSHNLTRNLNVWCLYFRPGFGRAKMRQLVAQLDGLERFFLCDTHGFGSPRAPWVRAVREFYEPTITYYRRKK